MRNSSQSSDIFMSSSTLLLLLLLCNLNSYSFAASNSVYDTLIQCLTNNTKTKDEISSHEFLIHICFTRIHKKSPFQYFHNQKAFINCDPFERIPYPSNHTMFKNDGDATQNPQWWS